MSEERVAPPPLSVDRSCEDRIRLGWIAAEPIAVCPASRQLHEELDRAAEDLGRQHAGRTPGEVEGLAPARRLYRAFGIDPTRTRPSSEALLRRILRGQPLPRILNAVDVGNLCAVRFLLPIGLFDRDRIRGPVTLRAGRPGESYPGIRKADVHLAGRPVLVDDDGPFGNPTSDSARTAVSEETRSLWMVILAPGDLPAARMETHVAWAREAIGRHLAGDRPVGTSVGLVP